MSSVWTANGSDSRDDPRLKTYLSTDEILQVPPVLKQLRGYRLRADFSAAGASRLRYDDFALTAWSSDEFVSECHGYIIYIRDLDTGRFWSAGLQPLPDGCDEYGARFEKRSVFWTRVQEGIRSSVKIVVPPAEADIRVLRLRNETDVARRLEITSYLELVLNDPIAHERHPAFSRLFVQTEFAGRTKAIRAWRRRRSPDERTPILLHCLYGDGEFSGFETSRADFIGRGRDARDPIAFSRVRKLKGLQGSVLDPIASLSRTLDMAPRSDALVFLFITANYDRLDLDETQSEFRMLTRGPGHGLMPVPEVEMAPPAPRVARPSAPRIAKRATEIEEDELGKPERLLFFNGFGGFTESGDEYVIRLRRGDDGRPILPPQPWTNVIANDGFGFIVSETGAGCTWAANSREYRLTPWFNDPVSDPHGEAFFVRDEDKGRYWSLMAGPAPAPTAYEVRHGLGYSSFRHVYGGLEHETTQFVARDEPVKITIVRLRNLTDQARRISVFGYHDLVLGTKASYLRSLSVEWDFACDAILVRKRSGNFAKRVAFVAARGADCEQFYTTSRRAFLGSLGSLAAPYALQNIEELEEVRGQYDSFGALQLRTTIGAHGQVECAFLLGSGLNRRDAGRLMRSLEHPKSWHDALEEVRSFWTQTTGRIQVRTPVPEIDLMVNRWLPYQNLSCRIRGRSAFYQSGGAFGYRDQLQDAAALLYVDPALTRAQILLHAGHQFIEGDVLHWWHPPKRDGLRTRFSDDLLWLPYVTAFYVRSTGDRSVLDDEVHFLQSSTLEEGEDEVLLRPHQSGERGSVYEHCCRALDRSLTCGEHGLPLMGTGDWNDGMNRVGRLGRGESVWLGFFIYHVLGRFIPLCTERGDYERAELYASYREQLEDALNTAGWDGEWYRRAFYDNGDVLGSSRSDECRIDALVQAWAVISGAAPGERAAMALDAVERELVDEKAGIIRLLTPPFDKTENDPGYIKGYVPGVRENGGQYTHGVLWVVRALAESGRGGRAGALLKMLSPISHAKTPRAVAKYRVEPYVIAADVYGEPPHVGRGGWTWYTGSAGWMCRVTIESLLGFRLDKGEHILLEPSIPEDWPSFSIEYKIPDGGERYRVSVSNPDGRSRGVRRVRIDGREVPPNGHAARIPIFHDGNVHEVELTM